MKIKKLVAFLICLSVILSMYCGISVFAEGEDVSLPWQYNTVVHDFSSFTTAPTGWRANAGTAPNYNQPTFNTAENLDYTGGNLKISYPKLSGNEMTWELKLGTAAVFTDKDKAVSIDIDASALDYSPKLQMQFRQLNGSYYRTANDSTIYFIDDNGAITTVKTADYNSSKGAYVAIPKGFKGTVVFDLSSFTVTNAAAGSNVYGITDLVMRTLIIDVTEASEIIYDNVKYYSDTAYIPAGGNGSGEGSGNGSGEGSGNGSGEGSGGGSNTNVTFPWQYSNVIADFSPSTAAPSCWGTNKNNKPTIAVENETLSVQYVAVTGNEMTWEVKLSEKGKPAATDGGIGIDVDTSSLNYAVKFQLRLYNEGKDGYKCVPVDSTVYLVALDKTVTAVKTVMHDNSSKGAYVDIPAGFKGTIVFSLNDYTDGTSSTKVYDFEKVTVRGLIIDTKVASTIVFDNIAYFTNVKPEEPAAKVYDWKGVRVVMNLTGYEQEIAKEGNKSAFGVWGGSPTKIKRENCTMDNGRLKVTYPKGDEFAFSFRPGNPIDGDLGIAIKVDASKLNYSHRMRLLVSDEGIGYLQPTAGTVYYLIDENGKVTEAPTDGSSSVTIPAGFKGTVAVEFSAMNSGSVDKVSISEIKKWPAFRFQLRVFGIKNDGDVVYYDDIGFLSKKASPITGQDATAINIAYAVFLAAVICGALTIIGSKKVKSR